MYDTINKSHHYMIKHAGDLSLSQLHHVDSMIQLMKENPDLLIDYIQSCDNNNLSYFMNQMSVFYFGLTHIREYALFLEVMLLRNLEKGIFVDYHTDRVVFRDVGLQYLVQIAYLGSRLPVIRTGYTRGSNHGHHEPKKIRRRGKLVRQEW